MEPNDRLRARHPAESMLAGLLQATGTERLANTLWNDWPQARAATLAVAWRITDRVLHPSGYSLLSLCLVKAFRRHDARRREGIDAQDPRALAAYLSGLFEALPALVEVRVTARGAEWDPLYGMPLGDWLRVYPDARFDLVEPAGDAADRNPAALRLHWLGQMLPAEVLAGLGAHVASISQSRDVH